jgi:hypothetical protein
LEEAAAGGVDQVCAERTQIHKFAHGASKELVLPGLNSADRRAAHRTAEALGLAHVSGAQKGSGSKGTKDLTLSKPEGFSAPTKAAVPCVGQALTSLARPNM